MSDRDGEDFALALVCGERHPAISEADDIYAPLLGSWTVMTRDVLEDGSEVLGEGEWIFGRVLDGRAVQDVWIAPARQVRGNAPRHPRERYGSSMRTFDPASKRWQVTWFNPVSGAFDVLHARVEEGKIVQLGSGSTGTCIEWTFEHIGPTDFHWVGRSRGKDGKWRLNAEFLGRRTAANG